MIDAATPTILGRLAVAAFVMVAPTILFLGLWRGLQLLRDDVFIERWLAETDEELRYPGLSDAIPWLTGRQPDPERIGARVRGGSSRAGREDRPPARNGD